MRRFRIQRSGSLVRQQHGRPLQQAAGDGNALLFTAGQSAAAFAAAIIRAPLLKQPVQLRACDGRVELCLRKAAEHGHIVADGSVEYEHPLLDHRHQRIQRFRRDSTQLRIVQQDPPAVIRTARHQQIQQRGFPTAAAADNGVGLPRLKAGANALQRLALPIVAEGYVP